MAYASRGSDGFGNFSYVGSTPQISRAYSSIVRSLENLPLDAMLWMAISNHFFWFCETKTKWKNVLTGLHLRKLKLRDIYLIGLRHNVLCLDVIFVVSEQEVTVPFE